MKVVYVFVVFVYSFFVISNTLFADENEFWSFERYPQPSRDELTEQETLAFNHAFEKSSNPTVWCRLRLQVEYSIYLKRYPEYFVVFDEREQIKQWRRHIASNPNVQETTCLYDVIREELYELNLSQDIGDDFLFCGPYSRKPQNRIEARAKYLIDKVIIYTHFGTKKGFALYRNLSSLFNMVYKPEQFDYYFARLEDHYHPSDFTQRMIKYNGEFLTKESTAFLDKAAAIGDYQAVLDILPECSLSDKKSLQKLYKGFAPR